MRQCTAPDCKNEGTHWRDEGIVCPKHYYRLKTTGSFERPKSTHVRPKKGYLNKAGYRVTRENGKQKFEHVIITEKALGRPLPPNAQVHHVTEDKADNYGFCKLVICPDQAYHALIHKLMREKGISFAKGWPNGPIETTTSQQPQQGS